MSLFDVGRLCLKIAGRDGNRKCVVVEAVDNNSVIVDGDVRRKKVNINHLEPLADVLEIKQGASHEEVKKVFTKLGLTVWERTSKHPAEKPKQQRTVKKKKPAKEKKAASPAPKGTVKKTPAPKQAAEVPA